MESLLGLGNALEELSQRTDSIEVTYEVAFAKWCISDGTRRLERYFAICLVDWSTWGCVYLLRCFIQDEHAFTCSQYPTDSAFPLSTNCLNSLTRLTGRSIVGSRLLAGSRYAGNMSQTTTYYTVNHGPSSSKPSGSNQSLIYLTTRPGYFWIRRIVLNFQIF